MARAWKTKAIVTDRDGHLVMVDLAIEIDWDAIARKVARMALRNKSRRAGLIGGAIKGKLTSTA